MDTLGAAILCFVVALTVSVNAEAPFVQTGSGTLRGKYEPSRNGLQYEAFLGIRYAQVSRRFDISVPTGSWDGIRDAVAFGPHCAQQSLVGSPVTGEEDCLYLNVYTPKADNEKRPVLVWIHGGGFSMGAGTEYGAGFLIDENIILVTLNYRLGILGFLNTPRGPVAGNMGLKDQVQALKWVQKNIEHFGGDKDRVTIGGNSAGSASVQHLMTSPLAQGLFHGVYGSSGSPLNPFGFRKNNLDDIRKIGEHLSCKGKDQVDLVTCLRDEPLETLMLAQKTIAKWNLDLFRILPTIELKSPMNPEPFLDETPAERLHKGEFQKVPVLLTVAKDEGAMIFSALIVRNSDLLKSINDDFSQVAPVTFMYENEFGTKSKEVTKKLHEFYFDKKVITPEMEENLTQAYSDTWFLRGIRDTVHILAPQTKIYMGLFTHGRQDFSPAHLFGITEDLEAVTHTEDLSYVFHPTGHPNPIPHLSALKDPKNIEFSKKYVRLLASFIKNGVPELPFDGNVEWKPVSKVEVESKTWNLLELDGESPLHVDPFRNRMKFWDKVVGKLTKHEEKQNEKFEL